MTETALQLTNAMGDGTFGRDHMPHYSRIAEMLQQRIGAGSYAVGHLLPGEPALAREFGVSRSTVRQALNLLRRRGVLQPEVGRGTRVLSAQPRNLAFALTDFNEEIQRQGQVPAARLISREVVPAPAEVARRLCTPETTEMLRIVLVRLANQVPIVHETRFLALQTCPQLLQEDLEQQSVHRLLLERYAIPLVKVDLSITRVPLPAAVAVGLNVPAGTIAFCLDRLTYRAEGQPVTWFCAFYRSDHFDIAVHH